MRYKCAYCGCIFDEEDAGRRTEHEEFWGAPCSITYNTCPECGEDISDEDEYTEDDDDDQDVKLTKEQWENLYDSGYWGAK